MFALTVYGTAACHLCDEALDIARPLADSLNLPLIEVDIAGDTSLEKRYGLRIPVIAYQNRELNWPFDLEELAEFLAG